MKYGPYTRDIEQIVEDLRGITLIQEKQIYVNWETAREIDPGHSRDQALYAVAFLIPHDTWEMIWKDAWSGMSEDKAWTTLEAASDAIIATLVQDKITKDHFHFLRDPWSFVVRGPL